MFIKVLSLNPKVLKCQALIKLCSENKHYFFLIFILIYVLMRTHKHVFSDLQTYTTVIQILSGMLQ